MKYAIVQMGGKQFKIKEGQTVKLESQPNLKVDVLAYHDGKNLLVGTPVLSDYEVDAVIEETFRDKKIRVAKFRAKSRYRKVKGHRQEMSIVKFNSVSKKGSKAFEETISTQEAVPKKVPKARKVVKKVSEKAE